MADIKRIESREFRLDEITVGQRLREVSESGVASVLASLEETKLIGKHLWLRQTADGLELIDGAHRLEAAKRFGLKTVLGTVFACNAKQARLLEIDGNLAGAELNALDTAVFLARRKKVYEELHPEAKAATGAALVAKRWNTDDTMSLVSFSQATSEKFELSQRHVQRLIRVGEALDDRQVSFLRKAPKQVTLKDLIEISKIGETDERDHVIKSLVAGETKSASAARKAFKNEPLPPKKDPVEKALNTLLKEWIRAPKAAKRRFVNEMREELTVLTAAQLMGGEHE